MAEAFNDRWWTSPDGLKLHARDYAGASGPARLPVICIHGLTRNARDFEAVAPYIAETGRRVLAVSVRGRGLSAWDPRPMNYQPPAYAKDMVALMAASGIARAVFVGTSMGGLITMLLASTAPRHVAAAALNDIGPEVSPVGLKRIASYTGQAAPVESWEEAAAYCQKANGAVFPTYGADDWMNFARRTFTERDGKPALDYDPDISAPIRAAGPKALAPNLWPMFRTLAKNRRLMLIRGQTSDLLDVKVADKMRKLAPAMAYVEVEGVGHAPMLTEPAAREGLLRFLDGCD